MIRSFADEKTRELWLTGQSRKFRNIASVATRRLQAVDFAARVEDLRIPSGNRPEKLRGDREGRYSIRINDQFRVCFRWDEGHAWEVEITDYH
ncbi:MAG: type II toxin-antitoxin system RelE/ParE family toxin [Acidobacteriaceae bacterium]